MASWTILTCEYPPACGGVGDYTAQVAGALAAAGDEVTVFCPPMCSSPLNHPGVDVIVLDDVYGRRGRREIDGRLNRRRSTLLVQYVPTAFGLRGANIPWCRWLEERARRNGDDVRVMFHEPYFEFAWTPIHQNALALAQRLMAKVLLRAATQVYVSTDAWRRYLTPYAPGVGPLPLLTLPIPSAIPRCDRPADAAERRRELTGSSMGHLVGHFGTYGSQVAPMLRSALMALLTEEPELSAVCVGAGGDGFARSLIAAASSLEGRLHATGRASASEAALVLTACDLLLQPYPDGVTTRRTSVMAGLINARAVLTTTGHLTEPVWTDTRAVALTSAGDNQSFVRSAHALLADHNGRAALAARAEKTYRERFSLAQTIEKLRGAVEGAAA